MRLAQSNDKKQVVAILAAAFEDNKSVNYILPQDEHRIRRIEQLMAYSFELCRLFGKVYLSDDGLACALMIYPELKKANLKSVLLDVNLIFNAIGLGNIKKAINRESKIKAIQPKDRMAYLWFVGVHPDHQHQGIGGKLMGELIDSTSAEGRPIYLETSTVTNLPWYQQFGFNIYHQLNLGYELFFLKRV